jgi:EAL domain-containing protein (putative c-di-GMP-specific phosphodiesterase class I)
MYEAKARGRASHAVFDPHDAHPRRDPALHRNRPAPGHRQHQLELHYQPIKWLAGHQIVGVEALVRWRRPDDTLVPPGEFIPVAEETRLLRPLGRWVLHEACGQLARWRSELIELDCNHGQGFLLGHPVPSDELAAMIQTGNATDVTAAARLARLQ